MTMSERDHDTTSATYERWTTPRLIRNLADAVRELGESYFYIQVHGERSRPSYERELERASELIDELCRRS